MAQKKKPQKRPAAEQNRLARLREFSVGQGRWLLGVVVLVVLLLAGGRFFSDLQSQLAGDARYRLSVAAIEITPPPPWVRCDIKSEVFRNSDLLGDVSILTDAEKIHGRLVDAFELHPWVEKVEQIELLAPAAARVKLSYRRPVAAIEVTRDGVAELLPVDATAVRLPDGDLSEAEKRYLPRITDAQTQVLVGEPWTDSRIVGAVRLAFSLLDNWERLHLVDIVPSTYPEIRRSQKYYVYELRASYGTRIRWGAAPGIGPSEEDSVETKLARLSQYVAEHGPLNTSYTPAAIDVRDRLVVEQRTAKGDEEEVKR